MARMDRERANQVKIDEVERRANTVTAISNRFGPEVAEAATNFVHGYLDNDPQGVIRKPSQELSQAIANEVGKDLDPEVRAALGRGLEAVLLILNYRLSTKMNTHIREDRARRRGLI